MKRWNGLLMAGLLCLGGTYADAQRYKVPAGCSKKVDVYAGLRMWDGFLARYAKPKGVDYNGIRETGNEKFEKVLCAIAHAKPDRWGSKRRFAFWLNAYNALVIQAVLHHLPDTITGQQLFQTTAVKGFFKKAKFRAAGRWLSLDQIENQILRPKYRDARLHFALCAASKGGPTLPPYAMKASKLSAQLTKLTRSYVRSYRAFRLMRDKRTVWLSKTFLWYHGDFAKKGPKSELAFIAKYAYKNHAVYLNANWKKLVIRHIPYNWKLNISKVRLFKAPPRRAPAARKAQPAARVAAKRPVARPAARRAPAQRAPARRKAKKPGFSHAALAKILRRHVRRGRVDYNAMRKRSMGLLRKYLAAVAQADLKTMKSRRARFAFWINAYNAVTLLAVLERLPSSRGAQRRFSVVKAKGFWKKKYRVARRMVSLNQIENKILRPRYRDARLHFALVCASHGCPDLINRPYRPRSLYWQMSRSARAYFASSRAFALDRGAKVVKISQLFKWYRKDFAKKGPKSELLYIAKYVKKADGAFLKANWKSLSIKYLPYSWKLNIK